jgi:release factor glutamine methyltransferase
MQLKQALEGAVRGLEEAGVGSPRMNAEVLLMFVLTCDRAYLYAHPERGLTDHETARYQEALEERARGVPAQYIVGHQEFWGLDLIVTPAVLIPRPETEHVVETVLDLVQTSWQPPNSTEEPLRASGPRIIDVGTGSGCIVLALAKELSGAELWAGDVSAAALEIARVNAARLQLSDRVAFAQSDLLEGIGQQVFDFVVSNPPYVGESEADKVQREVRKFEPKEAVFGGQNGLDIFQRLIPQAHARLAHDGWLVMEIGYTQEESVRGLLREWAETRVVPDLQGIPRVVAARR